MGSQGPAELKVGDTVVIVDMKWVGGPFKSGHEVGIERPPADSQSGPSKDCTPDSFVDDPDNHQYCCQPHESREAGTSDWIAERRAAGEMNPEVWHPVVDMDHFDTPAAGTPTESQEDVSADLTVPHDLTQDDVD